MVLSFPTLVIANMGAVAASHAASLCPRLVWTASFVKSQHPSNSQGCPGRAANACYAMTLAHKGLALGHAGVDQSFHLLASASILPPPSPVLPETYPIFGKPFCRHHEFKGRDSFLLPAIGYHTSRSSVPLSRQGAPPQDLIPRTSMGASNGATIGATTATQQEGRTLSGKRSSRRSSTKTHNPKAPKKHESQSQASQRSKRPTTVCCTNDSDPDSVLASWGHFDQELIHACLP